jgi:ribokinase
MRLVCAGHVNHDVTLRLDRLPGPDEEARVEAEHRGGGGSAGNVATALAGLDAEAAVLGSVGDDERGARLRRALESSGVDCAHLVETAGRTASKHLLVDDAGRVATLGRPGANEAYAADDLPDATLRRADWLHLTGQDPETALALAERAAAADVPVSVDPGRRAGVRDDAAVLARADAVLLNAAEAERLCGPDGSLPGSDATVVVTRGAEGAEARTPGGVVCHPGYEVDVCDPTGAGDAFAAGFLLTRGTGGSLRAALAVGNACGALAASRAGARAAVDRAAVGRLLGDDRPPNF